MDKTLVESIGTIQMSERERARAMAQARLCADMLSFFRTVFGLGRHGA